MNSKILSSISLLLFHLTLIQGVVIMIKVRHPETSATKKSETVMAIDFGPKNAIGYYTVTFGSGKIGFRFPNEFTDKIKKDLTDSGVDTRDISQISITFIGEEFGPQSARPILNTVSPTAVPMLYGGFGNQEKLDKYGLKLGHTLTLAVWLTANPQTTFPDAKAEIVEISKGNFYLQINPADLKEETMAESYSHLTFADRMTNTS